MKTLQKIFECKFTVTTSRMAVNHMCAWVNKPTEEAMPFNSIVERWKAFEKEMLEVQALKEGPIRWAPPPWKTTEYINFQQKLSEKSSDFKEKNSMRKSSSRMLVGKEYTRTTPTTNQKPKEEKTAQPKQIKVEDIAEPQATIVATENKPSVSPRVSLTSENALDSTTPKATPDSPVPQTVSAPLKDVETAPKESQDDDKLAHDYSDSKNYGSLRKYIAEAEVELSTQKQMLHRQKFVMDRRLRRLTKDPLQEFQRRKINWQNTVDYFSQKNKKHNSGLKKNAEASPNEMDSSSTKQQKSDVLQSSIEKSQSGQSKNRLPSDLKKKVQTDNTNSEEKDATEVDNSTKKVSEVSKTKGMKSSSKENVQSILADKALNDDQYDESHQENTGNRMKYQSKSKSNVKTPLRKIVRPIDDSNEVESKVSGSFMEPLTKPLLTINENRLQNIAQVIPVNDSSTKILFNQKKLARNTKMNLRPRNSVASFLTESVNCSAVLNENADFKETVNSSQEKSGALSKQEPFEIIDAENRENNNSLKLAAEELHDSKENIINNAECSKENELSIETPSSQPEMIPAICNKLQPKRVKNILNRGKYFAIHGNNTTYHSGESVIANLSRSALTPPRENSSVFSNPNQLKPYRQKELQLRILKQFSDASVDFEKTVVKQSPVQEITKNSMAETSEEKHASRVLSSPRTLDAAEMLGFIASNRIGKPIFEHYGEFNNRLYENNNFIGSMIRCEAKHARLVHSEADCLRTRYNSEISRPSQFYSNNYNDANSETGYFKNKEMKSESSLVDNPSVASFKIGEKLPRTPTSTNKQSRNIKKHKPSIYELAPMKAAYMQERRPPKKHCTNSNFVPSFEPKASKLRDHSPVELAALKLLKTKNQVYSHNSTMSNMAIESRDIQTIPVEPQPYSIKRSQANKRLNYYKLAPTSDLQQHESEEVTRNLRFFSRKRDVPHNVEASKIKMQTEAEKDTSLNKQKNKSFSRTTLKATSDTQQEVKNKAKSPDVSLLSVVSQIPDNYFSPKPECYVSPKEVISKEVNSTLSNRKTNVDLKDKTELQFNDFSPSRASNKTISNLKIVVDNNFCNYSNNAATKLKVANEMENLKKDSCEKKSSIKETVSADTAFEKQEVKSVDKMTIATAKNHTTTLPTNQSDGTATKTNYILNKQQGLGPVSNTDNTYINQYQHNFKVSPIVIAQTQSHETVNSDASLIKTNDARNEILDIFRSHSLDLAAGQPGKDVNGNFKETNQIEAKSNLKQISQHSINDPQNLACMKEPGQKLDDTLKNTESIGNCSLDKLILKADETVNVVASKSSNRRCTEADNRKDSDKNIKDVLVNELNCRIIYNEKNPCAPNPKMHYESRASTESQSINRAPSINESNISENIKNINKNASETVEESKHKINQTSRKMNSRAAPQPRYLENESMKKINFDTSFRNDESVQIPTLSIKKWIPPSSEKMIYVATIPES